MVRMLGNSRGRRVILRSQSPFLLHSSEMSPWTDHSHTLLAKIVHKTSPRQFRGVSPMPRISPMDQVCFPEPRTPHKSPPRLKPLHFAPKLRVSRLFSREPWLNLSRLSPLPRYCRHPLGYISPDLLTTPLADGDDEDRCEVQVRQDQATVRLHTPLT